MKAYRLALLLLLAACQATEESTTVSDLMKRGDFEGALSLAQLEAADTPDDPYHANVELMAHVAVLMDQGRQANLDGDLALSLERFFEAEALAPGHPVVADWITKVVSDLADRTQRDADAALMNGNLEHAAELYERALVFEPDFDAAKAGLARTLVLVNHRKGLGEKYYKEGVRSLREYWLGQAGKEFATVEKFAPDDKRGGFRSEQVAVLLAQDRALMASDMAAAGLYHAARNEYRIALLLDETNKTAQDGLAHMDKEVAAFAKLGEAERATLRGDFKGAKDALVEGYSMSEAQSPDFASAKIDLDEARWKKLYQEATDAEADGRYEYATKLYDQLLAETGFFEDAAARRQTALDFIKLADRLYGEAQAAKSPEVRRQKLEQIAIFWPEYKNVAKLLGSN